MMTMQERSITVDRKDLIRKLEQNLEQHRKDYAEAVIGYRVKLITDLEHKLAQIKSMTDEGALTARPVEFKPPVSYEAHYLDAIEFLSWAKGDTIVIDSTLFKQYVQNEWAWKQQFDVSNSVYKTFAASASR